MRKVGGGGTEICGKSTGWKVCGFPWYFHWIHQFEAECGSRDSFWSWWIFLNEGFFFTSEQKRVNDSFGLSLLFVEAEILTQSAPKFKLIDRFRESTRKWPVPKQPVSKNDPWRFQRHVIFSRMHFFMEVNYENYFLTGYSPVRPMFWRLSPSETSLSTNRQLLWPRLSLYGTTTKVSFSV